MKPLQEPLTHRELAMIIQLAQAMIAGNEEYRYGQAFFNALHLLLPDIANQIRATELDPFNWEETEGERWTKLYAWLTAPFEEGLQCNDCGKFDATVKEDLPFCDSCVERINAEFNA